MKTQGVVFLRRKNKKEMINDHPFLVKIFVVAAQISCVAYMIPYLPLCSSPLRGSVFVFSK